VDYLTSTATGAGRQNRAGVGVSYRKDFDHIGDVFRKKKNRRPAGNPETPVEVKPEATEVKTGVEVKKEQ
jgi:hypothetical protein